MHEAFADKFSDRKILEVSTKSENPLGVAISAHNLMLYVPSLDRKVLAECVYHDSKVFTSGGPYTEIYDIPPIKSKKYLQEVSHGELCGFHFDGKYFPLGTGTAFYDWLYINALSQNSELIEQVLNYNAFTDIAYTPAKSMACQARTVAMFVSLYISDLLGIVSNFNNFKNMSCSYYKT